MLRPAQLKCCTARVVAPCSAKEALTRGSYYSKGPWEVPHKIQGKGDAVFGSTPTLYATLAQFPRQS
jgi:hypothetical protein